jgi:hypothetical protein
LPAIVASGWFRNPDRFPCSQAVQDIRAEIDTVRPDDRARFGVNPDPFEKLQILQGNEDPATTGDPSPQVNLARSPVGETQLEAVLSGVPNLLYAWKHHNPLFQRPNPLCRLLIVFSIGSIAICASFSEYRVESAVEAADLGYSTIVLPTGLSCPAPLHDGLALGDW